MYIDVFYPLTDIFGEMPEVGDSLTWNNLNVSTNIVLLHHLMTKQLLLLHLTLVDCILWDEQSTHLKVLKRPLGWDYEHQMQKRWEMRIWSKMIQTLVLHLTQPLVPQFWSTRLNSNMWNEHCIGQNIQQTIQTRLQKPSSMPRRINSMAEMWCSDRKTTIPICKSTHLLAPIVVVELLGELAALFAMDSRVMAVHRSSTIMANHVDHLGACVEGQNDLKKQFPRSSGPQTFLVGVGRGLSAVLGRWSCRWGHGVVDRGWGGADVTSWS
jgi:hypothetical protein